MALGGNVLRQHVVEFIRGVGVVTDGVVDATSLNGPWSWQVPDGVAELTMDAAAGGQSGMGGAPVTGGITSAGGGAGGSNGACMVGARVVVRPASLLTIALAAGGAATTANQRGNNGGDTTVSGVLAANLDPVVSGQIRLAGASSWQQSQPTSVSSGQGLGSNSVTGAGSMFAPPDGVGVFPLLGALLSGRDNGSMGHGGAGNASGAVAGFSGASLQNFTPAYSRTFRLDNTASGTTDGTTSRGGGGLGTPSFFGRGGNGGSNAAGENSPSYGAGGGGGAGGFGGGAGGDGYVRFTYWSMD